MKHLTPIALTIAGSDSSGGAGLQADLKTFQHFRIYGMTAVTCVVAETPREVRSISPVSPDTLREQLEILLATYHIAVIKTGMLFSKKHVMEIAKVLGRYPQIPLVVDPVMVASTGQPLCEDSLVAAYEKWIFPRAMLVTPNLDETAALWGKPVVSTTEMQHAARDLAERYQCAILCKGGHLPQDECVDVLATAGGSFLFSSARVQTSASHGTGCTLSAAIAANLALGNNLSDSIGIAKTYLTKTLENALQLGEFSVLNQGTTFHVI